MKKIITTALLAGSLMSIFGATALFAEENQSEAIQQKAKVIVQDAKTKGDRLIKEANVKAKALLKQAKEDVAALEKESAQSMKETTAETRVLASEAMEKAKVEGHKLVDKTKTLPQDVKQEVGEKYVYIKEAVNKSYEKGKDATSDTLIYAAIKYAFLMSKDIHSMQINVDVKDGAVELFGKVKSAEEAEKAILIALSTKGVWVVKSFFVIRD